MKKIHIIFLIVFVMIVAPIAIAAPPSIGQVILNSSNLEDTPNENLTRYIINATDLDGDSFKNITDWLRNSSSIAMLNMPFEGGSNGTFTKDYSVNGANGTVLGATFNSTGGVDGFGAYQFDGVNDFINVTGMGREGVFNLSNKSFSVSVWALQRSNLSGVTYTMVSKYYENVPRPFNLFYLNGLYRFQYNLNSLATTPGGELNVWNHLVGVYNHQTQTILIYRNGVLRNNLSGVSPIATDPNTVLYIGANFDGGATGFWNGTLDEVQVWDRALSSQQILALYTNRSDLILSNELQDADRWRACVTPNDRVEDGGEVCSNIVPITTPIPPPRAVSTYCNETVVFANSNLPSSDYNVTQVCSTQFYPGALVSTTLLYYILIGLLSVAIMTIPFMILRLLLSIPVNLLIIFALQTNVLFLEATSPELTSVILLLNTLYYFCIAIVMPLLVIPFMYIAWGLIRKMLNPQPEEEL